MMDKEKRELQVLRWRIDWICKNKVNAFSPTISPAQKSFEKNEIESAYEALKYYFAKGVREFVVQKKYMGSYCDIYLCKNIENTYFVSRNGYIVDRIDLEKAKESLKSLHSRFDWTNLNVAIIQSEMLPWSAMGKRLIEGEFEGYINAHNNHFEHISSSDLYSKIEKVKQSEAYINYNKDRATLSPKELTKKYASHIKRQYDSIESFIVKDLEAYKNGIDIFEKQIGHFGKEGEIYFKPFNILKKIFDDGSEEFINDNLSYIEINDDAFLHFTINNESELEEKYVEVEKFYKTLSAANEEGIMVKPRTAFIKGLPPAFKVRNDDYLVMIYGVNFINDYRRQINKRNIAKKLECSINDWMLNWQLLKVKYNSINIENYYYKNLIYDRIMGEKIENNLDNRL